MEKLLAFLEGPWHFAWQTVLFLMVAFISGFIAIRSWKRLEYPIVSAIFTVVFLLLGAFGGLFMHLLVTASIVEMSYLGHFIVIVFFVFCTILCLVLFYTHAFRGSMSFSNAIIGMIMGNLIFDAKHQIVLSSILLVLCGIGFLCGHVYDKRIVNHGTS